MCVWGGGGGGSYILYDTIRHWNITYKRAHVCSFVGMDGCILLTMLVDVCQHCRLFMFVCLPLFLL